MLRSVSCCAYAKEEARITPAMEAGLTDHVWSLEEIAKMVEDAQAKPGPRGPYKKKTL
jgi:hypothetical protein